MLNKLETLKTKIGLVEINEETRSLIEESLVEGQPPCTEEVHPGSDCTSRLVAWNQVPRHKLDFSLKGLSVAFISTDLKPLNNNFQRIKLHFLGVIIGTYKEF